MSELRSALDGLLVVDDAALSDDQLVADLDEVERATRQLETIRARRLGELERRQVWSRDGHFSLASWLATRHRVAPSTAASHVRMARALEAMPVAADALATGDVSSSAITLLASAREEAPEQFARSEGSLVDAARTLSGDLNAETTQVLITALRAVQDAEVRSSDRTDTRSPARRRADALGEICRQWLDSSGRPTVAGERPHVIVTIDVESLGRSENAPGTARSAGARLGGRLTDVGPISATDALMWTCDAQVTRVITDAGSRPLDVGRTTRITPPWIRKALLVRDGGCVPSPTAGDHPRGAIRTTLSTGPTVVRPHCRTSCCCVGDITG